MSGAWRDVRYALRTMFRFPAFTLTVTATLALGIGANTAIFSVVDAVLLRSLPYPEPDRLVSLWQDVSRRGGPVREWFSYDNFTDLRDDAGILEAAAVWGGWNPTLTGRGEPAVIRAAEVSEGMFSRVLRVHALLGRTLVSGDDVEGAPRVVILSYEMWQRRFGGDASVVGRTLSLEEVPYTVVGVLPEGFRPPFLPEAALWRAMGSSPSLTCPRGCFVTRAIGRLAPGVSLTEARTRAAALATRLAEAYPEADSNLTFAVFDLREDMTRRTSRALWVLLGAVGFVLLIACTNVANLLLARGAARTSELAVRVALGAGRAAVIRQLLTESILLAVAGAGAGLALASWGTETLLEMAPPGVVPRLDQVGMNGRVLGFTATLAVVTGILFGLLPAWRAARSDVRGGMQGAGRGRGVPGRRVRRALAVTQMALALVLLVGAGLLIRSLKNLDHSELGFDPDGVWTMSLALPAARYPDGADRQAFFHALLDRIENLPGVRSAGIVNSLPLAGTDSDSDFLVEGEPAPPPGISQASWVRPVTERYFETVGMKLVEGRGFTRGDDLDAPRVVIVNETLARRYFRRGDAVGSRIGFGDPDDPHWRTIVGIAGDIRHFGIREDRRPATYFPYRQVSMATMYAAFRVEGDGSAPLPQVRATVSSLDPGLAATEIRPLQDLVDTALAPDRFVTGLLSVFALVAVLLAAVGIYGVVAYGVTGRMREMGIRLALGANPRDVSHMVLRGGLSLALGGVVLGVLGGLGLTRVLASLLYEVPATDPLTFAAAASGLTGIALLASWLPARRAGRTDPVAVLREE